jgi:hypothetical protein
MDIGRRKTIYLDSTIPSYYYEERKDPIIYARHLITVQWWNTRRRDYEIFVSDFVLREISDGDYPHRDKVISLMKETQPQVLEANVELAEIVEVFMEHFLMPRSSIEDAWHLAFASYYKIDFLLTWNCKHLANANKQEHIFRILSGLKLYIPIITTPENLLEE